MRPGRILLFFISVILTLALIAGIEAPEKFRKIFSLFATEKPVVSQVDADTVLSLPVADTLSAGTIVASDIEPTPETTESVNIARSLDDSLAAGKQVRILFYGDSQLEGDRITSRLRLLLREEGGGRGPGLISPVMPVMYTRSFVIKPSASWKRYTLLDYKKGTYPNKKLGPMLSVCRFTEPGDSLDTPVEASVKISKVPGAAESVSRYDFLRVFYGNNTDTTIVNVFSGGVMLSSAMLKTGPGPEEYKLPLHGMQEVTIVFRGRVSPDIYALSLESGNGVIVDNIPVRGSAGLEFTMTDKSTYRQFLGALSPDLIILQYGLNIVRNVRSDYHYYEEGLVKQIEFLKEVSGGVPVLLVSLTDMAQRTGDSISSFRNIPAIRDAQRNAAERTGIIFWDAWKSMGGEGSIVKWFENKPALASEDLTHLSNAGADTIATRLYADLFMHEQKVEDDINGYMVLQADCTKVSSVIDSLTVTQVTEQQEEAGKVKTPLFNRVRYNPEQSFIFTTPAFWIFFVVVMAGFALLRKKKAMCHTWLMLVSVYFYYKAGGLFVVLLLFTSLITYVTAVMTDRTSKKNIRRFWLSFNIIILLGLLSYFKYAGFITDSINTLLGTTFRSYDFFSDWSNRLFGTGFDVSKIILPVGISFFTFQALSYNIDVYRGRMRATRNFVDFSFYLTFFPQLVAGPIVRASEFIPQMYGEYRITRNEFGHSLFLIIQGLIKKMIISEFISVNLIDRVFDSPALYSGFENLMAVYGYGLQIYCDFSGYTDIAIGVSLLMGFRLPLNFNSPYKAANISDFWSRWHISLSRWLKDYLYIPLGGNRKGTVRTGINLMLTMLLGGLWHGAAFRFVLWGGLHGAALVINKLWKRMFRNITKRTFIAHLAGILVTFNFVSFAWILFRAGSMDEVKLILNQIVNSFSPGAYHEVISSYLPVIILILSGYLIHFLPVTIKESYRGLFIKLPIVVEFIIVIGLCLILHQFSTGVVQPFIYFRF